MSLTKVPAAMTESDLATQAELDVVSGALTTYQAQMAAVATGKITGDVVQQVYTESGAVATGTTVIPADDTIPQITEGNEYLTRAITPLNASNILKIEVCVHLAHTVANTNLIAALFQDATAGALAAAQVSTDAANTMTQLTFTHLMVAGTVSATTFRVRAGSASAGTTTFNGASGARLFGGVLASTITISEIKA